MLSLFRNCGNVFCKDCCHLKLPIPDQQLYDPVLVCNICYDLLLVCRTREIRSQQLKKAIATASSWEKRRLAWPASALSCSFWTDELSAPLSPQPAVVLAAGGRMLRRNCYSLIGLGEEMHYETVLRGGRKEKGSVRWRRVSRGKPFWSETFSGLSPAASSGLHTAPPPPGAPYEALLPPVHPPLVPNTCTLLTDTVSHFRGQSLTLPTCRGTPKPLPVLLEAFNFKRK